MPIRWNRHRRLQSSRGRHRRSSGRGSSSPPSVIVVSNNQVEERRARSPPVPPTDVVVVPRREHDGQRRREARPRSPNPTAKEGEEGRKQDPPEHRAPRTLVPMEPTRKYVTRRRGIERSDSPGGDSSATIPAGRARDPRDPSIDSSMDSTLQHEVDAALGAAAAAWELNDYIVRCERRRARRDRSVSPETSSFQGDPEQLLQVYEDLLRRQGGYDEEAFDEEESGERTAPSTRDPSVGESKSDQGDCESSSFLGNVSQLLQVYEDLQRKRGGEERDGSTSERIPKAGGVRLGRGETGP